MADLLHENAREFYFPGNKTGILLIHGFTGSPAEMRYLGDYLKEKGFTVSGVLLKGHGATMKEMRASNHLDWIQSAETAYQELEQQCKEIFVVGLSMGGAIGLYLAQKHSVKGIVSLSTPIRINSRQYCTTFIMKQLGLLLGYESRILRQGSASKVKHSKTPTKNLINLLQLINMIKGSLHKIDKPILVMQSYRDGTVHPSSANFIYNRVASADKSIIFLHNSGHVVTCDCEKEQVFDEVFSFISKRCKPKDSNEFMIYSETMEV